MRKNGESEGCGNATTQTLYFTRQLIDRKSKFILNHNLEVYLERAIAALREHGIVIDDEALAHLSPIGWEHVNLTGDYAWQAVGHLR
jgi:hypothetical protein